MDGQHMNNVPPDYNKKINNDNPESAPQTLPDFFKMIYEKGITKKPDAVIENCPCGCCINFYNLQGMNQAVSSDPTSSWQIRLKGKVYHALNPHLAYYGDHVELSDNGNDFASSFGVGAVLGTKFTWPKDNPYAEASYLLTPEKEKVWKKWFDLYNNLMLSKGEYLGNLYDIGFDKPETHVIKKENTLYYAFYANNWNGKVVLKGLDKKRTYRIADYVNHKNIALLKAGKNEITVDFNKNLLLMATPVE
jgi:alpha-galactosidase